MENEYLEDDNYQACESCPECGTEAAPVKTEDDKMFCVECTELCQVCNLRHPKENIIKWWLDTPGHTCKGCIDSYEALTWLLKQQNTFPETSLQYIVNQCQELLDRNAALTSECIRNRQHIKDLKRALTEAKDILLGD